MTKPCNSPLPDAHSEKQQYGDITSHHTSDGIQRDALRISIHDKFEALERAWIDIEEEGDLFVFQSFQWLRTWQETVGQLIPVQPCLTLIEDQRDRPLMILPLGIEQRGAVRCLVWLGGKVSDYHGPLLCKEYANTVDSQLFVQVWEDVVTRLPSFDVILFEKQPEWIGEQKNPFVNSASQPHPSDSHSTQLSGTLESFIQGKRTKKSIAADKRKERRLGEHGQICFVVAETRDDIEKLLPVMLRQKSRSYSELGVSDLFATDGCREFIKRISAKFNGSLVFLCALTVGEEVSATFWGLVYKNRLYYLFPTYENDELARYSPGNILLRYIFNWCLANGVKTLDFTVGDESYKTFWCDQQMKLYDHFEYRTPRGWFLVQLIKLQRRLKRRIKNSPTVLKAFLTARKFAVRLPRR